MYVVLTQNKTAVAVFMVIKEHVSQHNSVAHVCCFNSFWRIMECYDMAFVGFVDNKKNV